MINPLKFMQSVKQEAFKVSWPARREVLIGSVMVFALASIAAIFFLLADQFFSFLLDLILTISI
jgi:preprotein translocase subunit SecE